MHKEDNSRKTFKGALTRVLAVIMCVSMLSAMTLCLTGCDKTMLKDEAATRAPERTTSMGDRIEQGLTNASERASEGLSEAGSRIRDGVTDASEALSDAMDGKRN